MYEIGSRAVDSKGLDISQPLTPTSPFISQSRRITVGTGSSPDRATDIDGYTKKKERRKDVLFRKIFDTFDPAKEGSVNSARLGPNHARNKLRRMPKSQVKRYTPLTGPLEGFVSSVRKQ